MVQRVIGFCLTVLLFVGCSGTTEEKQQTDAGAAAEEVLAEKAAGKMVAEFSQDLKSELLSAINDSGPAHAIAVCRTKAPEIASAYTNAPYWSIRRVSENFRNPDNAPNEHEGEILRQLADSLYSDKTISEWNISGPDSLYAFYKPIRADQLCLNCHGQTDNIDSEILNRIAELYPEDNATGYSKGDLRGMFVVTMQWPEAKEYAENLVSDSTAAQ